MERYDYEHEVRSDLKQWLKDEYFPYKGIESAEDMTRRARDYAYDDAFVEDAVTGNASGSYFCNSWKAEEAVCHNLDLLREAIEEFGGDIGKAMESAESADVTIRCYILGQVFDEVWDEVKEEFGNN
jgi:predicted PhzF superfamily epimerase YddE/YHI9